MADPEDKRLENAWEALWVGVIFAGGLAVSFGAAGMCRQGSLTPGSSHCGCRWEMGLGMETSLLPFSCSQAPELLGAASSCVPQVEGVCALPPPHREISSRGIWGGKWGREGVRLRGRDCVCSWGVPGRAAWLGCPCPGTSPASPAAVGCRGCCALASAPAAREIKGTAAAVPALEFFCLLGCAGPGVWNWSSSAGSGMSRSDTEPQEPCEEQRELLMQGWVGRGFG